MTLFFPNRGEVEALKLVTSENLTLRLYSNDPTIDEASEEGDFTAVSGGGYADKTLAPGSWVHTEANPSYSDYPVQTFTFTGAPSVATVVGALIIRPSTGRILCVEEFSNGPYRPTTNGDIVRVTPRILLGDAT